MAEMIVHSIFGCGDPVFPCGVDPVVNRKAELRANQYAYNLVIQAKELQVIDEKFSVTK